MKTLLIIGPLFLTLSATAQPSEKKSVVIGSMTERPNALLIVNPQDADQGVLLPQLSTSQRIALKPASPSEDGLLVFDTSQQTYYYWSNDTWVGMDAYNSEKNKFHSIDPADFQSLKAINGVSQDNLAVFETDNTFVTATRDGSGEEIIAPVSLPHGAVLKELALYYLDNDSDNISVRLMRKSLTGNNENILNWVSSGATSSIRSESFGSFNGMDTIDLENYTYRLLIVFDIDPEDIIDEPSQARQRIYGVKIKYQL